jgi:hypothetical protein
MKTHSKSTGEFVDLARECTTTTRTLLSLSLSLHRQIDFAITFKFSQEERVKKYSQKQTQKLSQTLLKMML